MKLLERIAAQLEERRKLKREVKRLERSLDKIANVLEDVESMHGPLGGRFNADLDDDPLVQIDRILVRTWGSTHKPKSPIPYVPPK